MTTAIKLDEKTKEKLMNFKPVYDAIMNEKSEFNDYVKDVLLVGLRKMLR